jgi:CRISPR/Cas system CSM-associated protein Csm3 (group 7 of RAMP superfamily)
MTRQTYFAFNLTLTEAGGVTRPAEIRRGEADLLIDTDASGRPMIPGTSLAGALRARLTELVHETWVDDYFGSVGRSKSHSDDDIEANASRVWVFDAACTDTSKPVVVVRTSIDRERGAARTSTLMQAEELSAGTTFRAYLRIDDVSEQDKEVFINALSGWSPAFGRGTSSGHGRVMVSDLRVGEVDLAAQDDLVIWLTHSGPDLVEAIATEPVALAQAQATNTLTLQFTGTGPVAFGSLKEGNGPPWFIPGRSVKGLIRSRMEFILRSVRPNFTCGLDGKTCGECPICELFGWSSSGDGASEMGARGRIRVLPAQLGGIQKNRAHIAIDRFTGGVAMKSPTDAVIHLPGSRHGQLYSTVGIEEPTLEMRFEIDGLGEEHSTAFLSLLTLVCQDIDDGLVGIGGVVTRGYGTFMRDIPEQDPLPSVDEARKWVRDWGSRENSPSEEVLK